MSLLEVRGITKRFGGLTAVSGVEFTLSKGQVKSLVGPNGAGKTTCFNLITGVYVPNEGEVHFQGRPMTGCLPHELAKLGASRTFQHPHLFKSMSVLENVMVGCHRLGRSGYFASAFTLPLARRENREASTRAMECLERVGMADLAASMAGDLPSGQQKLLEVARALASQPDLLMLDEPAAGLNDSETAFLADLIKSLQREGLTILVVEHNMDLVMSVSDSVIVLNYGTKIAEGTPYQVQNDPKVLEAYLGSGDLLEGVR